MYQINFIKLHKDAIPFKYNHENDACMDMFALEDVFIFHGTTKIIPTGIAVELPRNFEGQVRGRSGLSSKGLIVHLGTVDEGYRGDIGVIMHNAGYNAGNVNQTFKVNKGDRIGQFSIHPVYKIHLVEVPELSDSERGTKGYGSSGI